MSKKVREVFSGERYQKTPGANVELHDSGDFFLEKNVEYAINQMGNDIEELKAGGGGMPSVETLSEDVTYFVSTTGDNANDGLSLETPFASIAYALSKFPKALEAFATINVVSGIYAEEPTISGFSGSGTLVIQPTVDGETITVSYVRIEKNTCREIDIYRAICDRVIADFNTSVIYLDGCAVTGTQENNINSHAFGFSDCYSVFLTYCYATGCSYAVSIANTRLLSEEWADGSDATQVGIISFGNSSVVTFGNQPIGSNGMTQINSGVVLESGVISAPSPINRINHEEIVLSSSAWTGTVAPYLYEYELGRDPNDTIEGGFFVALPSGYMNAAQYANYKLSEVVAWVAVDNIVKFKAFGATAPSEDFTLDITFWDAIPSEGA